MIFRIGLPIVEDLINWLESDDDRESVKRVTKYPNNVEFRICTCICAVNMSLFESNKYSQYMDY